jgi:hypothetical protein
MHGLRWVQVEKRKCPGRPRPAGPMQGIVVSKDVHGTWLFAPAGERNTHLMTGLMLLPQGRWWVAWWWDDPAGRWCAADVATCPVWEDNGWRYDDLEIDVYRNADGQVGVVDEDEFEEARLRVPYPSRVTQAALAARDELVRLMTDGIEPFGAVGLARLAEQVGAWPEPG